MTISPGGIIANDGQVRLPYGQRAGDIAECVIGGDTTADGNRILTGESGGAGRGTRSWLRAQIRGSVPVDEAAVSDGQGGVGLAVSTVLVVSRDRQQSGRYCQCAAVRRHQVIAELI